MPLVRPAWVKVGALVRCSGALASVVRRGLACAGRAVMRVSVALAPDCPARGHRVYVALCGRVAGDRLRRNLDPVSTHLDLGAREGTEQIRPQQAQADAGSKVLGLHERLARGTGGGCRAS